MTPIPEPGRAGAFLSALGAQPRHPFAATDTALVVAHPDDETGIAGGQLSRLRGVTVVHVTDGAPRNREDARRHGFAGHEDYAAARARELAAAMAEAGLSERALVNLGVADQQAALQLAGIARWLAALFAERRIGVVVTHPYEGGHPDHDATAFAVHAACALAGREGVRPGVVEAASYHAGPDGAMVAQEFPAPDSGFELILHLDQEAWARKQRMLSAHVTQQATLAAFASRFERFRAAPAYDFTALPNGGRLFYEQFDWGMTGARWRELAAAALRELGLGTPA
jgi:LmbE family N-acetylglucosaminyl deacetylase